MTFSGSCALCPMVYPNGFEHGKWGWCWKQITAEICQEAGETLGRDKVRDRAELGRPGDVGCLETSREGLCSPMMLAEGPDDVRTPCTQFHVSKGLSSLSLCHLEGKCSKYGLLSGFAMVFRQYHCGHRSRGDPEN